MSGFPIDWLNLREAADLRARDKMLKQAALDWLGLGTTTATLNGIPLTPEEVIITDLGAGTGSTLRALAVPGSQRAVWRLVDIDGALLDVAISRHGKDYRIEDYQSDLMIVGELPLGGTRLVTASALFDLASAPFIDALVKRLASLRSGWPCALYAALTYDGTLQWTPPHPYDDAVLAALNRDQRRDKGMGLALGPDAGPYLAKVLREAGFTVATARSPWQLAVADSALTSEFITGLAAAVAKVEGIEGAALNEWRDFRLAHVPTGTCTVGHVDILAIP